MGRQAELAQTARHWQAPASASLPVAQRALRWLLGLPEGLGVAIIIVTLFSLAVLAFAVAYDAPLLVPRERMSAALGYNAVFPVVSAVGLYVGLRSYRRLIGRRLPAEPPLFRLVATDLVLMALFLVTTYFHFSFKTWVQVINPNLYDPHYLAVDRALQPLIDLFYWIRANFFALLPHADEWYQAAFLLMFATGFCQLAITRSAVYPRFCIGILLGMCLGALAYLPAPALGPFIYGDGLNPEATEAQARMLWAHNQAKHGGMPWVAEAGASYFTGALAAMPSLHIAHAVVMTWFIIQARSMLSWLFLFICFWIVIESVASRWHYLIDLPAGMLLAVCIIWLTSRLCPLPAGGHASCARVQRSA